MRRLKNKPYVYGEMVLPHDAQARELGTGRTRVETLRKYWPGVRIRVLPRQDVADGIHAVRTVLPMCWFDAVKCDPGIKALKNYERKWDPKNKIFLDRPLHNWASHGADAFRYLAEGERPESNQADGASRQMVADNVYDLFGGR